MNDFRDFSEPDDEQDPLKRLLEGLLGADGADQAAEAMRAQGFNIEGLGDFAVPHNISDVLRQMQFLMNSSTEPVNWRLVEDYSKQHAFQAGDPQLTAPQVQTVKQALSVANLWLDPVTNFTAPGSELAAWTRVNWVEDTLPGWKEICNPIAANASRAMAEVMGDELGMGGGLPEELQGLGATLNNMMPKMAAMAFGAQVGQALTAMAKDALGASDSGLPLTKDEVAALVPTNVEAFGQGLEIPYEEILQYVAVREAAHDRLFASVPWLRHDLQLAILRYADQIALDPDAIADAARSIDPSDPESVNRAMSGGVFAAEPTEAQAQALARLETLLALIEGWVEVVTAQAVRAYLPSADRLNEMVRRRRVTGSPADTLLRQLVGLDLRPRQARNAAHIFSAATEQGGAEARDGLWAHPDRVPTAQELADPDLFFNPKQEEAPEGFSQFDSDLEKLLDGTLGWDDAVPLEDRGPAKKDSADTDSADTDPPGEPDTEPNDDPGEDA